MVFHATCHTFDSVLRAVVMEVHWGWGHTPGKRLCQQILGCKLLLSVDFTVLKSCSFNNTRVCILPLQSVYITFDGSSTTP